VRHVTPALPELVEVEGEMTVDRESEQGGEEEERDSAEGEQAKRPLPRSFACPWRILATPRSVLFVCSQPRGSEAGHGRTLAAVSVAAKSRTARKDPPLDQLDAG